ncbi:MAG TPA: kelch repeat-containing protein, partial [Candidatus Acidoferrum sp.]|nr:kelch repeat-containing protein [Candidatus Acidoferrum sp.]
MFFSSQLLTNGNLWVAGGEDGKGGSSSELYNPLNNTWTLIPPPATGYPDFSDSISEILPNGNTLVPPVYLSTVCLVYNVTSDSWQTAASCRASQDEADWVKLPNDNIVTIDAFSQNSEHYIPSLNEWVADGTLPAPLYDSNLGEIGTGHLLPNGKVFYIGSTTNTAIYTPGATVTSAGSWVAASGIPNGLGAADAPAAMMVNGNILCCLGPSATYNGPCSFYEYDYTVNTFTQVSAPGGGTTLGNTAPFGTSMLALPDGTVLFIDGQNGSTLYVYTPDGTPLAAGQPVVNGINGNADGSYTLTGTGLNGISEGAAYGDDEQMNGNYPLIRMTNNVSKNVYYARTFNWNSTSVETGSRVVTTDFNLPENLPAGTYSLVVTAVGNASEPQTFTYSPPAVPAGLSAASGSNDFVSVQWNSSPGATSYAVKRALNSSDYFATIATVFSTNYTDARLTNGLTYYYKISAVGGGGPSSDSAAASATPAGPPIIPGAAPVSLASYYNRTGIYTDGRAFSTGLDGGSSAYSVNLLGNSIFWNNLVFAFGPVNIPDVVACVGQTISLTNGQFNTLEIVATGVQGNQLSQPFTVTYTDNSASTFTQSLSDWANPQSYPGEYTLLTMPYRDQSNGSTQNLNVTVDAYVFTLNQTKTIKSITLPNNLDVVLLSMTLANNTVAASLRSFYNRAGIYNDGVTFTNPATGGLDGGGEAYSAN